MKPAKFVTDTDVRGKPRSGKLKAVARALATYDVAKTKPNLYTLVYAILEWRASKSDWGGSIRHDAMIELVNYVKTEAKRLAPNCGGRIFNHCQAKAARDELFANPMAFLRKNRISIAGTNDGPTDYYMIVDSGDLIFDSGQLTVIPLPSPISGYKLSSDQGASYGAKLRNTMSIGMHKKADPKIPTDVTNLLVPLAGNVVVTGMLTACTFVIRNQAGVSATHLQPPADGNALQDTIAAWNIPNVTLYGKRDYTSSYTHVIGFGNGPGNWRFYAQRSGSGNSIVGVDEIRI